MFFGTVLLAVVAVVATVLPAIGVIPRNQFVGIRVPGAGASEQAWRQVHRRAMPYAIGGAIIGLGCGFVAIINRRYGQLDPVGFFTVLAGILVGAVVGAISVRN